MNDSEGPDLDRLEAQHAEEEAEEAKRTLIDAPRPLALRFPRGGELPESQRWLERLYAGDLVLGEARGVLLPTSS